MRTEIQPTVFLSGFSLDDDGNIKTLSFYQNDEKNIPVRIYNSPPFEVNVNWEFMNENGDVLENGTITFPPNALDQRKSCFFIEYISLSSRYIGNYRRCPTKPHSRLVPLICICCRAIFGETTGYFSKRMACRKILLSNFENTRCEIPTGAFEYL